MSAAILVSENLDIEGGGEFFRGAAADLDTHGDTCCHRATHRHSIKRAPVVYFLYLAAAQPTINTLEPPKSGCRWRQSAKETDTR